MNLFEQLVEYISVLISKTFLLCNLILSIESRVNRKWHKTLGL